MLVEVGVFSHYYSTIISQYKIAGKVGKNVRIHNMDQTSFKDKKGFFVLLAFTSC